MNRILNYILLTLISLAVVAGIIGVLYYARSKSPGTGGGRAGGPVPVVVSEVVTQEFIDSIEAIGTVQSNEAVTITARVSDIVTEIHFSDGDLVKAGDVLIRLSDARAQAELAEAQANLVDQEKQLRRIETLVASNALPQSQLDERRAMYNIAKARVSNREAALAEHEIKAPFTGVLGMRMVSVGSLVTPGTVITTLDDISTVKLDFSVPESFLSVVIPGQTVVARSVAYPGKDFEGKVTTVSSRINPVTRAVTVRAELPNTDHLLRPGMLLTLYLERNRRQTILIPEGAIVPIEGKQYVFIVNSDVARRVEVTTGARQPGMIEVTGGLEAGQTVIVEGAIRLRDGAPIRIIEQRNFVAGPSRFARHRNRTES